MSRRLLAAALNLAGLTADPAAPGDGDHWLRTDLGVLRHRAGGVTITDTPSSSWPAVFSQRWVYTNPGGGNSTVAPTQNTMYALPFMLPRTVTVTDVALSVSTVVAGSTVRLGLHAAGTDGLPGARLGDFGTVSAATAGTRLLAVAGGPTLTPSTLYFVVAVTQGGAPALRCGNGFDLLISDGTANPSFNININAYLSAAAITGPLPDPFGAVAAGGPGLGPRVAIRFA